MRSVLGLLLLIFMALGPILFVVLEGIAGLRRDRQERSKIDREIARMLAVQKNEREKVRRG